MIPGRSVINVMSQQEQLMRLHQQQQEHQQIRLNMMSQQQVFAQQGAGVRQYVGPPGQNPVILGAGGQLMVQPGQIGAVGAGMARGPPQQIHVINPGGGGGGGPQYNVVGGGSQQQQAAMGPGMGTQHMVTNEDVEYNRKRDEMRRLYLLKVERIYQQACILSSNSSETAKTKAVIDVLMGIKKVPMEVLLKCEQYLIQIKQQPMVQTSTAPVKNENVLSAQQVTTPAVSSVPIQSQQSLAQQQPQQQQQHPVIQAQPAQKQPNSLQKLLMSIEACSSANPVHKNNIRYLLDSIRTCIEGPHVKISQVDSELIKSSLENDDTHLYAKKMPNFVTKDGRLKSSTIAQPPLTSKQIPIRLLIELASLSDHKFRIELKSGSQTLTFPLEDDDDSPTGNGEIKTPNLVESNSSTYLSQSDNHSPEKDYIILTCLIVDKSVALVPPIRILLPYTYPDANPLVDCTQLYDSEDDMLPGYNSLGILRRVNKQFQLSYLRLPERFSVTQVLDAWYSSVESLQYTQ